MSSSLTTKTLSKMAVCVAIICISAYISFPITAVPFTCLTLAMLLSAFLSTPKETLIITIVYTLIGAIGLPVFLVVQVVLTVYFPQLVVIFGALSSVILSLVI